MKRRFSDQVKESICIDYIRPITHLTMEELAEKYSCSLGTIYNILDEFPILRRGRGKDLAKRQARIDYADKT